MNTKARLKILNKIAQQVQTNTPPSTPDTSVPATPGITPPPNFVASDVWGWLNNSYNSYSVSLINNLSNILNISLHYASNGKYNFQILRNNGFQIDPSAATTVDSKNLLNLSILVFKTLLNNGNQFPQKVSGDQISRWVQTISTSQALLNLSQLSPVGTIAQKIPGNFKDNILNLLRTLQMYNPVQPMR